jgi:hypothetical protein
MTADVSSPGEVANGDSAPASSSTMNETEQEQIDKAVALLESDEALLNGQIVLSTTVLQQRYQQLQRCSDEHSTILTSKLASSQDGQNLLHIGTSLQSLPTDLHTLLTTIHPVVSHMEQEEATLFAQLQELVQQAQSIQHCQKLQAECHACIDLYADLLAMEQVLPRLLNRAKPTVQAAAPEPQQAASSHFSLFSSTNHVQQSTGTGTFIYLSWLLLTLKPQIRTHSPRYSLFVLACILFPSSGR